ncbi:MAG TPA: hypothetical protein VFR02_01895, partial [bacterium]|nr:hypothetical protein [bacterium]
MTVFQDLLNSLPSGPAPTPDFSRAEKILQEHLSASRARYLPAADWKAHPAWRRLSRGGTWEAG